MRREQAPQHDGQVDPLEVTTPTRPVADEREPTGPGGHERIITDIGPVATDVEVQEHQPLLQVPDPS